MFESIQKSHDYVDFFKKTIVEFGGKKRQKEKYVFRRNVSSPFPDRGAYFGCISENEEPTGAYSDLSIVVFPSNEPKDDDDKWIIALGVGSLGFKNDYHLVTLPGTRRMFVKYLGGDSYIKSDFMDIESKDGFVSFCAKNNSPETLKKSVEKYQSVLLASSVLDPNNVQICENIIKTYLAIYASLRGWSSNESERAAIKKALVSQKKTIDEKEELDRIQKLLEKRKYIVLQGAPGTGKTRMAKKLVEQTKSDNIFFTQFHAETAHSDFIYGITPDVSAGSLMYAPNEGIFVKAVRKAKSLQESGTKEKVFIIIDEINRANLSNVLGPAFYLFEPSMSGSKAKIEIEICPELSIEKLPDNLYVIATMNTADRSLAVVDYALRRRFAWYTMYPHAITADIGQRFCEDEFNSIDEIFEEYATDEELNLQPGQAYFIVSDKDNGDEIKDRLKYEVMPLIKEYLANGIMIRAKDDFIGFFRKAIDEEMYL